MPYQIPRTSAAPSGVASIVLEVASLLGISVPTIWVWSVVAEQSGAKVGTVKAVIRDLLQGGQLQGEGPMRPNRIPRFLLAKPFPRGQQNQALVESLAHAVEKRLMSYGHRKRPPLREVRAIEALTKRMEEKSALALLENLFPWVYLDHRLHKEAKELIERIILLREKIFEPEHPDVAVAFTWLGSWHRLYGDRMEARQLLSGARSSLEMHLGTHLSHWMAATDELALMLCFGDEVGDAKRLLEETLDIARERMGPDSDLAADRMMALALLAAESGTTEETVSWVRQAIEVDEHRLGAGHPDLAHRMNFLVEAYRLSGQESAALEVEDRICRLGKRRRQR